MSTTPWDDLVRRVLRDDYKGAEEHLPSTRDEEQDIVSFRLRHAIYYLLAAPAEAISTDRFMLFARHIIQHRKSAEGRTDAQMSRLEQDYAFMRDLFAQQDAVNGLREIAPEAYRALVEEIAPAP